MALPLLTLTPWVTLEEAAQRIGAALGEAVSLAMLARMAAGGHLRLAVHLTGPLTVYRLNVHRGTARAGGFVPRSKHNPKPMPVYLDLPALTCEDASTWPDPHTMDARWVITPHEAGSYSITGQWDIEWAGRGKLIMEHLMRSDAAAPEPEPVDMRETALILSRRDENWCVEWRPPSLTDAEPDDEAFLKEYERVRAQLVPDQATLIVRSEVLAAFLVSIKGEPTETSPSAEPPADAPSPASPTPPATDKPLDVRERDNLLRMIGLLAIEAKFPIHEPSKAAGILEIETQRRGIKLGKATMARQFERAAILLDIPLRKEERKIAKVAKKTPPSTTKKTTPPSG